MVQTFCLKHMPDCNEGQRHFIEWAATVYPLYSFQRTPRHLNTFTFLGKAEVECQLSEETSTWVGFSTEIMLGIGCVQSSGIRHSKVCTLNYQIPEMGVQEARKK